jgi:hypothetical protein
MDIKELQEARKGAEEEIRDAIQTILDRFAEKTGLPIENVYVVMGDEPREEGGRTIYWVEKIMCEVRW